MILLGANLLIYAVNADAPLDRKARAWLESGLSGQETIGFPWNVLLAFLRLTTRHGLFQNPLSMKTAFDVLESWLQQPSAIVVHPVSDAHLAAIALEHGAELCSTDTDFARFKGLKWRNPLK